MTRVSFNSNGLSSRENKVLKIFEEFDSGAVSTETLRLLTGYGHKVIHKTLEKLVSKGYLKKATTSEVRFFKPDKEKLKEALGRINEEGLVSDSSEVIS